MVHPLIGLAGGFLATLAMTVAMAFVTRRNPGPTIPDLFGSLVTRRSPTERKPAEMGLTLHFVYGGGQGLLFVVAMDSTDLVHASNLDPTLGWFLGAMVFAALLWVISLGVVLPLAGSRPKFLPRSLALLWLGLHLLYGVILGLVVVWATLAPGGPAP